MARLTLEGEIPVKRPHEKKPLFKIKLMAGSDDSLNIKLTGPDGMPYGRILHRDTTLAWKLGGKTYLIWYATTEVAADKPAESHFAFIFGGPDWRATALYCSSLPPASIPMSVACWWARCGSRPTWSGPMPFCRSRKAL